MGDGEKGLGEIDEGDTSVEFGGYGLAGSGEGLDAGSNEVANGELGEGGNVGGFAEGIHAVITLHKIVEGGDTIAGGRVDGVALHIAGDELAVGGDDERRATDGMATGTGNGLKEACELCAGEGGKGEAVLEGEDAIDVTHGDVALRPEIADATVVGNGNIDRMAVSSVTCGTEDIGFEVVHESFRTASFDVARGGAEDRRLDVYDTLAVLGKDSYGLGILREGVGSRGDFKEGTIDDDSPRSGGAGKK